MSTSVPEGIAFFLPLHNEGAILPQLVPNTLAALDNTGMEHTLVLVIDGGTDSTADLATRFKADNPDIVQTVHHPTNMGYGRALRTGFRTGLGTSHSLIGFMDGDGQFDPQELPKLLAGFDDPGVDAVVGIRNGRKDKPHRLAMGWGWKAVSRQILDCPLTDVDCGYKVFRRGLLEAVLPELICETGAAISPELVCRSEKFGAQFKEVLVEHAPRKQGKSSGGNLRIAVRSIIDLAKVRHDLKDRVPVSYRTSTAIS